MLKLLNKCNKNVKKIFLEFVLTAEKAQIMCISF